MKVTLEEVQNALREPRAMGRPNGLWDFLQVLAVREEPLELAAKWLIRPDTQKYLREEFLDSVVMVYGEQAVGFGGDLGLARDSAARKGFDPDDCWPYFVEPDSVR